MDRLSSHRDRIEPRGTFRRITHRRARALIAAARLDADPGIHLRLDHRTFAAVDSRHPANTTRTRSLRQQGTLLLIGLVGRALTTRRADLCLGPTEDLTPRRVGTEDAPVGRGAENGVGTVVEQHAVRLEPEGSGRAVAQL